MGFVIKSSMKSRISLTIQIIAFAIFLAVVSFSCKDDYTTGSTYQLRFSTDTIAFDTIFSKVLTSTRIAKVYNTSEENVLIESISLLSESSCFQINVNGMSGKQFTNQELKSGDSLFIFIQAFPPENGINSPLHIQGKIEFRYNNQIQQIELSAFGQDVNWCKKLTLTENSVWDSIKPYLVYDSLVINEGVTLEIKEGTSVYMHHDATIVVKGNIIANGTSLHPILIRGDRNDIVTDKISYDQLSNQWGGIFFQSTSTNNQFVNVNIRNGKYGFVVDSSEINSSEKRLTIGNCHIHNMQQQTLQATYANIYAYNSLFTNGENGCVILQGGEYLFNHCTIAGYEKGAGIYNNALTISDKSLWKDEQPLPIASATFNNCIIYGSSSEELKLLYSDDIKTLQVFFNHTLIKSKNIPEEFVSEKYFKDSYISEDPLFSIINTSDRLFDFHLNDLDVARKLGDINIIMKFPECQTDKDGIVRPADTLPDLGAYQYVLPIDSTET